MRNVDTRPASQNAEIFGVFALPVFKVHVKAARKHVYSSMLANFLGNFQLNDESSHIFWSLDLRRFHTDDCKVTRREGGGPRTHLKDLHLFSCMCCRKLSCKLSFFFFCFHCSGFISSSAQIGLWESLQQAFNQMWLPLAKPSSQPEDHTLIWQHLFILIHNLTSTSMISVILGGGVHGGEVCCA